MKTIRIKYFASLKEKTNRSDEQLSTSLETPYDLYQELRNTYHFELDFTLLKVAINDEFCDPITPLKDGDCIVFIPPIAGG